MPVAIRETIVTPDADGAVVQLRISDAALPDGPPAFAVTLQARVTIDPSAPLAAIQNAALKVLREELTGLLQETQKQATRAQ